MLEFLFNKVAGPQTCNFIKKRFQHRCFPVNVTKFLRTPFSPNTTGQLLLNLHEIVTKWLKFLEYLEYLETRVDAFWININVF